jgi:hypothetical protein
MLEPIRLARITPSIHGNRKGSIKVFCALELLQKPSILLELGKQGRELLFGYNKKQAYS